MLLSISEIIHSAWFYWTLTIIYAATIMSIVIIVVSENRNPVKSLAWLTVLLVVPAFGLVLYIVFGRNIRNTHIVSRRNRRLLRKLENINNPADSQWPKSPQAQQIIKMAKKLTSATLYSGNDAVVFADGGTKFERLLADLDGARYYINVQYYIFRDDSIGRRVQQMLIKKACEGIKVKVIYDHVGSFRTKNKFFKELEDAGVEIHPFFKVVFPWFGSHVNWRNHRKVVVIDGEIGYVGGMNIADRYVGAYKGGVWRDNHVRIVGPAVAALQSSFSVDWTFLDKPLLTMAGHPSPQAANMHMMLITSGPTSQWSNIAMVYHRAVSSARKRVFIQTPYFLPTEGLLRALQAAALAGVDVRVMMPRHSDSAMLTYASQSYVAESMRAGIKFFLFEAGMLHSKTIVIDDDISVVGSTNFDFRSFEHNFEASMFIFSSEFNQRLRKVFFDDMKQSLRINPHQWAKRPLLQRALSSFMRLFSPVL